MKKGVLISILIALLILNVSFAIAANNTGSDKGYECLTGKVKDKCSSLSSDERVFSLLAVGECKDSVSSDTKYKTNTRFTAQAILALSNAKVNTDAAESWLQSQNKTPENMKWLLQIESSDEISCKITYDSSPYTIIVGDNKKIDSDAGDCLTLTSDGYWLEIHKECYNLEFEISCDISFSTNLLYKKTSDPEDLTLPLYVSANTHSASAGGTTKEKVTSLCSSQGSSCDYEASLWAAIVLKFKKYDISPYIPYLITMMDENEEFLPESFLYSLTNNFRNDLLLKQSSDGYWTASTDKFYDTAAALLPFQNEELTEKTKSKTMLLSAQGADGCWNNGNLRDTAFLLYSLWPKKSAEVSSEIDDCEESNFFCMSTVACVDIGGNELASYGGCFGPTICCDKEKGLESCSDQGGELCNSDKQCLGGRISPSSDTDAEQSCCISGTCGVEEETASECENNNGFCKTSCSSSEESISYSCPPSDVCCAAKKSGGFGWIILILVVLIILVALGIVFRKQLRDLFFNLKAKFGKGKGSQPVTTPGGPRFPPTSSARTYPGAVQRKVITTTTQRAPVRAPVKKTADKSDFDDVLNKLKEIGK